MMDQRWYQTPLAAGVAAAITLIATAAPAPAATLVRDGEPAAAIVLAPDAPRPAEQAGDELTKHIELMTGATLPVLESGEDLGGLVPIRIGAATDDELDELIWEHAGVSDAFALIVTDGGVQLRGLRPVGNQHAAFALLEQLGVRWADPIDRPRFVPEREAVALEAQRTFATPSDEARMMAPVTPRSTLYTMRMKRDHLEWVRTSPYVSPTPTADEDFVIGQSAGWDGDAEPFHASNHVPPITDRAGETVVPPVIEPHDLHAYTITDPDADGPKVNIVLADGNHSEFTGSWSFHGTIAFLLSDEPEAQALRREAVIHVYPMVNPDGRSILSRVRNPEVAAAGWPNHNRAWDTAGRFSTIDAITPAIRYDTAGEALFLLDYHSNGTTIYSPNAITDSPLIHAMARHKPDIGPSGWQTAGSMQVWALRDEAVNATYAFTLEHGPWEPLERCLAIGRAYGLALHDVVTGRVTEGGDARVNGTIPGPRRRWVSGQPSNLLEAAVHGDAEAMRAFLEDGDVQDVNEPTPLGNTALHLAAEDGHTDIVRTLLDRGGDAARPNAHGWTPLHYAARFGHRDAAAVLIDAGGSVDRPTAAGDHPLHLAASHGHVDLVTLLLYHGAEPDVGGRWGRSPTQWAERLGYREIVTALQESGAGE